MVQTVVAIALLLSYFVFAIYAAKGGNLMIGFFMMTLIWCILGFIAGVLNWDTIDIYILEGGPEDWGRTIVLIIFGSWFGRVMVETGIAKAIITKAVELGGGHTIFSSILLVIVTAIIFTSSYGIGTVISFGVIIFPIMLSLGIPKSLAVSSFVMAVGAGMYVNMAQLSQMVFLVPGYELSQGYFTFGFTAFVVQLAVIIFMIIFNTRKIKINHVKTAKMNATEDEERHVSTIPLITPLIPVILGIIFKWQPIPSLMLAILFGLLTTGKMKDYSEFKIIIQNTFKQGVDDIAMVLGFLLFLQMFVKAAASCSILLKPIFIPIIPTNPLVLCIGFGVFSMFGLFRGPLTCWGSGVAILALMQATGIYSSVMLFPLFYIPAISMNMSCCPTQSWNAWAMNYNKVSTKEFMKSITFYGWLTCLINSILAYIIFT